MIYISSVSTNLLIMIIALCCYFSTSHGLALLITWIMKIFMLKYSTKMSVETFSIYPLHIEGIKLEIDSFIRTSYDSKLMITIDYFKVTIFLKQWITSIFSSSQSKPPVNIEIKGLDISIYEISFDDLLFPSKSSDVKKISRSNFISRWFMKLVATTIHDISISIIFPRETCHVKLSSQLLTVGITSNPDDFYMTIVKMVSSQYFLNISYSDVTAITMRGDNVLITGTQNEDTGMMEASAHFSGEHPMVVVTDAQAMLSFYNLYQKAEDVSIDIKISRGFSTDGKMRMMAVKVDNVRVTLRDIRNETPLEFKLQDIALELNTDIPQNSSLRKSKIMLVSLGSAQTLLADACMTQLKGERTVLTSEDGSHIGKYIVNIVICYHYNSRMLLYYIMIYYIILYYIIL